MHFILIFKLKNQLQSRSSYVQISDFMYKNQAWSLYAEKSWKYNSRDKLKKNAKTIQQFKCLLGIYILGYFLGETLFFQYLT